MRRGALSASSGPHGFAHRGGAQLWPENTLAAFEGAVGVGCTWLETDVHLSKDGELVLCHDPAVDRTTNARGLISELTLAEIQSGDAGHHFRRGSEFPYRGKGLAIPSLGQALDLREDLGGDVCLNIDIKPPGMAVVEALWSTLRERGVLDRVLVASAHHESIRAFRRLSGGQVATAASRRECWRFWAGSRLGVPAGSGRPYDALQVPPRHGLKVVTPGFIRRAHEAMVAVHVWTVDEPGLMRDLVDLGVDGIMTDRPDLLCTALVGRE